VQHSNDGVVLPGFGCELDFPHALAAVAAVLLEDPRPRRSQALRKLFAERSDVAIQMGVGAPAQMFGAMESNRAGVLPAAFAQGKLYVGSAPAADPGLLERVALAGLSV
jgi:hypothetical protein